MWKSTQCGMCGGTSKPVSKVLGVCLDCIRERWEDAAPIVYRTHEEVRRLHDLPGRPPRNAEGIPCGICSNECIIGEGEPGFCGLRWNEGGLRSLTEKERGLFYSYLDPHITNCCSVWFCPGGTGTGYPRYAYNDGPEHGYHNLAVFIYGCNFNCLYCQNSSHKSFQGLEPTTVETIVRRIKRDPLISCICFFGGSPEPQLPLAIEISERAIKARQGSLLRICFEWNGCGDPTLVRKAIELVLETGGNVKFDLKSFTNELSIALSGVSNKRAYQNFEMIAKEFHQKRREIPILTATTLMVPGYIDAEEVEAISSFIASLDPTIPYGLLAFHPDYYMMDLPNTSLKQAVECYNAATKHLDHVNVGNVHILGVDNMKNFKSIAKNRSF